MFIYFVWGEGDSRGWGSWMTSPIQWTWVCTNSRRQWRTGKPGVLQSMGLPKSRTWLSELLSPVWLFGDPMDCKPWDRLLCPWDFPGKNTGVGCHFLLHGIFLTQRLNLPLLHGRWILYHWVTREALCFIYIITISPSIFIILWEFLDSSYVFILFG